jgi:hypothetical protein
MYKNLKIENEDLKGKIEPPTFHPPPPPPPQKKKKKKNQQKKQIVFHGSNYIAEISKQP